MILIFKNLIQFGNFGKKRINIFLSKLALWLC